MSNAGIVRPDDKRESCTCFPAFFFLQAIGFTGAGQVSPTPIPNCNVLIQELTRVRDNAVPEFWYFEDEIWSMYALSVKCRSANEFAASERFCPIVCFVVRLSVCSLIPPQIAANETSRRALSIPELHPRNRLVAIL